MKTKKDLINIVTLGCSKNVVDSEFLSRQIDANNLSVVHDSNSYKAQTVIINTCGFVKDAKEESINTILQYADAKNRGLIKNLYVMGCLSERYKTDLINEIPDVDRYFGTNDIKEIVKAVHGNYKEELVGERLLSTPSHYAYLKISEGCDRYCSFCAIPLMRGKHRSKSIDDLVNESQYLVNKGVKELILIAQDLTYYGVDLYKSQRLADLLRALTSIRELQWVRLHYAYPLSFPDDVLDVMRTSDKICNYLDIPFQHISDVVLKKMRRGNTTKSTYDLISRFRQKVPGLTLRTTLLVGHPGETDVEFAALKEFVSTVKFDRLGVFTYSEEEGTHSAMNFKDEVPEEVKENRANEIMEIQSSISTMLNNNKIRNVFKVIIDRREGDYLVGRTESDSPEVDNEVLIKTNKNLKPGTFCNVKITTAESFDLFGELT